MAKFLELHLVQEEEGEEATALPVLINLDSIKILSPVSPTKENPTATLLVFKGDDMDEDALPLVESYESIKKMIEKE